MQFSFTLHGFYNFRSRKSQNEAAFPQQAEPALIAHAGAPGGLYAGHTSREVNPPSETAWVRQKLNISWFEAKRRFPRQQGLRQFHKLYQNPEPLA